MKKTLFALLALSFLALSCATDDGPSASDRGAFDAPRGASAGGFDRERAPRGPLELLPPSNWWRDSDIAAPVKLSQVQLASLDKLNAESDEIDKLQRDTDIAVRDLRTALETENPTATDIVAAANRVKTLRDTTFDRQVQLLAAERALLTQKQWSALEDSIANARRNQMRDRRGRGDFGGRGGYGGRGRGGWGGPRPFPGGF